MVITVHCNTSDTKQGSKGPEIESKANVGENNNNEIKSIPFRSEIFLQAKPIHFQHSFGSEYRYEYQI